MPNLAQMFELAKTKSYYSRTDGEVYAALNEAGSTVCKTVVKEFPDFPIIWRPIVNAQSFVSLPDEGTDPMLSMAVAELLRSNGDTLSAEYEMKAARQMGLFLAWVRTRQHQQGKWFTVQPYLDCE